jgi:hypothetical protein
MKTSRTVQNWDERDLIGHGAWCEKNAYTCVRFLIAEDRERGSIAEVLKLGIFKDEITIPRREPIRKELIPAC